MDHLQMALPVDQFSMALSLPEETLKKLYENVLLYGPNGDNVTKAGIDLMAQQAYYNSLALYHRDAITAMQVDLEEDVDSCIIGERSVQFQHTILLKEWVDKEVGLFEPFGEVVWTLLYTLMMIHAIDEIMVAEFVAKVDTLMGVLGLEFGDYLPASVTELVGSPS